MLDTITVLTTKGPLATKRIVAVQGGPPKIENYGKAQRFSFDEWPISSFNDMAAALKTLQHRERSFAVRGKPAWVGSGKATGSFHERPLLRREIRFPGRSTSSMSSRT